MARLTKRHLDRDTADFHRLLVISDKLLKISKEKVASKKKVAAMSNALYDIAVGLLERDAKAVAK